MRHSEIVVPADAEVEVVLDPCDCPAGRVCGNGDAFASVCPRRVSAGPFLVLRGTAEGPRYVARTVGCSGMVTWTSAKAGAVRFHDRQAAADLQEAIVGRYGIAVAVVPA